MLHTQIHTPPTGERTSDDKRNEVTRDNCQLTDTCSFAGQLTTVTPSHGNYNYTGPQGSHIPTHRWGEERDITRGIETDSMQQIDLD